jgi:hypothetical protein
MAEDVVWESVPGFDGYERNRLGEHRSWRRSGTAGRLLRRETPLTLKPWKDRDGYLRVNLYDLAGKLKSVSIAAAVLEMNVGPRPPGHVVRHFPDRTRTNNHPDNLRWGTVRENAEDMIKHGTQSRLGGTGKRSRVFRRPGAQGSLHYAARHPETRQGELNGRSKLTSDDVRRVRAEAAAQPRPFGLFAKLARELRVSKCLISAIVSRRAWPHLA